MQKRLALVALWVFFAAASVGVGFAAAGLVGDPFSEPTGATRVSIAAGEASTSSAAPGPATAPPRATARPKKHHSGRATGPARSSSPRTSAPAPQPVVRSLTTRGGLVSGSCRDGRVTISAAPAVGWSLDEISGGPAEEAQVKFRRNGGSGEIEVHARCAGGVPRFSVDYGGGSDSSGSGGGDD